MKANTTKPHVLASIFPFKVLLLLLVSVLPLHDARATLLFYDGFNYSAGETLGALSSSPTWENPKGNITITSGNLVYPALQDSTGNSVKVQDGSANLDGPRTLAWAAQTAGTLYFSFLLKLNATNGIIDTGDGIPIVNISSAGSGSAQLISINLVNNSGINVGVVKYPSSKTASGSAFFSSGTGANLSTDGATTCLIVGKYEWIAGAANDAVTVWVNPDNLGATESTANKLSVSSGADGANGAGRIYIDRGPRLILDELRIGQTWAEVTPSSGPLVAQQLTFTSLSPVSFTGETMNPVIVQLQTLGGFNVSSNNVPVTLALTGGSGTLSGTLTRHTDATGRAAFNDLSIDTTGGDKYITASAPGFTNRVSQHFWIINNFNGGSASRPVITQAFVSAGGFILRGKDGVPNGEYQVLSSTNVAAPPVNWPAVATNSFDNSGNFASTNPITPPGTRRFYRLLSSAGAASSAFAHVGYASVGTDIIGGGNTTNIVLATNLSTFMAATSDGQPATVYVEGTITLRTNGNTYLGPNKTIIGLATNATLIGDLGIFYTDGSTTYGATNIIIRNLIITNPNGYGEDDGITIKYGAQNIWVDHCTFVDCADGNLDVTRGSDFVTVSWCRFHYTAPNGHEDVNLIGGSDGDTSDAGKLHVTFHHNWWGALCRERMPSVRYGRAHVFNNYYNSPGNNYCTRTRLNAEVLVENNCFEHVQNPWELIVTTGVSGLLRATGNVTNNCTWNDSYAHNTGGTLVLVNGSDTLTSGDPNGLNPAPYGYTLDAAADTKNIVLENAGAGKGPFAP